VAQPRSSDRSRFKELTDRRLRWAVLSSVPDLIDAIELWAEHWYDDPKPFIWHAEATRSSKRSAADEQPKSAQYVEP
jgi:hypothetical protein